MTREEIEEILLTFSEGQDDYQNVVNAYNLGLKVAANKVKMKDKNNFAVMAGYSKYVTKKVIDKNSITKWKVKKI